MLVICSIRFLTVFIESLYSRNRIYSNKQESKSLPLRNFQFLGRHGAKIKQINNQMQSKANDKKYNEQK